jgi:hypothetical protein
MSLIDEILARFGVPRTRPSAPPQPTVYQLGGDWGDAIGWRTRPHAADRRVVGWQKRIPEVGDLLHAEMQSGRVGVFRFKSVRRPGDPPDMFFADVEFVGYAGTS